MLDEQELLDMMDNMDSNIRVGAAYIPECPLQFSFSTKNRTRGNYPKATAMPDSSAGPEATRFRPFSGICDGRRDREGVTQKADS